MSSDPTSDTQAIESGDATQALRALRRLRSAPQAGRAASAIVLFNFVILFIRPQHFVPAIGYAKLTVLLFLISFACWLLRLNVTKDRVTGAFLGYFAMHALFIVIGRFVYDDLILNDGRAVYTLKDLVQLLLCFLLPLSAYLTSGSEIRRFGKTCAWIGGYLGIVSVLNSGKGPGDFLKDENDLGLALNMLLPFPLFLFATSRSLIERAVHLGLAGITVIGVIFTTSRGSFIGLVCTLGYAWIRSPRKIPLTIAALVLAIAGFALMPQHYREEIMKLRTAAQSGTGKERLDSWMIGLRIWLDPPHIPAGVGLNNVPWHMEHYEGVEFGRLRPSLAGRHVHSMFVQLLADQGIIGLSFFGWLFIRSFNGNRTIAKESRRLERALIAQSSAGSKLQPEARRAVQQSAEDVHYVGLIAISLNVAWVAVLSCGAFLSSLYYPPVYILIIVSAAVRRYFVHAAGVIRDAVPRLGAVETAS